MSHTVRITTQVRDPAAVAAACERLTLPPPSAGTHKLFSDEVSGLAVHLPGWTYPVVCQTETGALNFDDFEGQWGERARLNEFLQAYAVEKTRLECRRQGHTLHEQALSDGSIKLTIEVGGRP